MILRTKDIFLEYFQLKVLSNADQVPLIVLEDIICVSGSILAVRSGLDGRSVVLIFAYGDVFSLMK
jgi:hypothetical protein